MKEPCVDVGILFEPQIEFVFSTPYCFAGEEVTGKQTATYCDGKILWQGKLYDELMFTPTAADASFDLLDVTIGINFHWERKEDQRFMGSLRIIVEDEKLTGINRLPVEEYLISVISSEMSATASLELLKAHAVISRSWLMAQIEKNKELSGSETSYISGWENDEERIRWYDREDHTRFDVCADDHCQRYQGITRASTQPVREAVESTRGENLMYDGRICDARFSKCCGGAFEEFQNCWEDIRYPYLAPQRDYKADTWLPDLHQEAEAIQWIRTTPDAFCNTTDKHILGQVLNNYDQETTDFYRWKVTYTQQEIADLVRQRSGIDFGDILDLIPVERGSSGRLVRLRIVGSKRTLTIGKELEIRRTFSTSHLYSSAFVANKADIQDGVPGSFTLVGAGWGHGVGLCQIGAAVMGAQGYPYRDILLHYYIGASLERLYE